VQIRQIIGFAGVGALLIGCFTPLLRTPLGSINYVAHGNGDGIFLLGIAGGAAYLLFTANYRRLWIPAGLAVGLCSFTFITISTSLMKMNGAISRELAGNPFRGLAEAAAATIGYGWAWVFLVIGLGCLAIAAFMPWEGDRLILPNGVPQQTRQSKATEPDEMPPAWLAKSLIEIKQQATATPSRQAQWGPASRPAFGKRFRV